MAHKETRLSLLFASCLFLLSVYGCRRFPNSQLIDIGVENAVNEADAWRLIWVLVWELDVNFPISSLERSYCPRQYPNSPLVHVCVARTLCWALESHVEFLPRSWHVRKNVFDWFDEGLHWELCS